MKRSFGRGTAGQVAAIVVIALLVAHGLSTIVWFSFDMRPGPPPEFLRPAAQIALVVRLLEVLPADDRARVLEAAADSGLGVRQSVDRPAVQDASDEPRLRGLRHALSEEPELSTRFDAIVHAPAPNQPPIRPVVVIAPANQSDPWLLFELPLGLHRQVVPLRWLSPNGVASFVVIPLLVGLLSIWAARRVTSPLVRLAAATASMSLMHDPPPVAEEGALEVRLVARAFNEMLARLRRSVADRTRTLAAVSHDLRTPLTRLRLRSETVADEAMRTKMLKDIRAMESMVTAALAFIREEAVQEAVEQVDLAVLLQTICDDFNDAGYDVRYEGPLHGGALCRPQALQRAINNLLENAVKFGAVASVRLELVPSGATIIVEDDGPGIPDQQKDAVFKPFFRGTAADGDSGVGLGLSLVGTIVESHGGTIELFDRIPSGLGVRLCLPR
jgi:signal transduction histidine kinase